MASNKIKNIASPVAISLVVAIIISLVTGCTTKNINTKSTGNSKEVTSGATDQNVLSGNQDSQTSSDPTSDTKNFNALKKYNIDDAKVLIEGLAKTTAPKDMEDYKISPNGGMIYNPLSSEALSFGKLDKYSKATKKKTTISLSGNTVEFNVPTNVTAYDVVPIDYKLTLGGSSSFPVYVQADAFTDEAKRKGRNLYDLNVPGKVDIDFEYLGYVAGTTVANTKPIPQSNYSDTPANSFPNYKVTELRKSGSIPVADKVWFKLKYTNVGDTIIDNDGNGTFCFEPVLYKKNAAGTYEPFTVPNNLYYRIDDYIYPGESGELWVTFVAYPGYKATTDKILEGDYKITINSLVRNEQSTPDSTRTLWAGFPATTSSLMFSAKSNSEITTPASFVKDAIKAVPRNKWLHSYEEFMSGYDTWYTTNEKTLTGTIYVQVAPWSNSIVLKLINGATKAIATAAIPISTDTASLKVNFNANNNNYVVKKDGTRYPALTAQNMVDMRVNVTTGPDIAKNITNQTLDLIENGINMIVTTSGFNYNTENGKVITSPNLSTDSSNWSNIITSNWFSMDLYRKLNIPVEGFIGYPFNSPLTITIANWISGKKLIAQDKTGFGDPVFAEANGIRAKYNFGRWGDNYWQTADNRTPIVIEDTRGWLMPYKNVRFADGFLTTMEFRTWLTEGYSSIGELNKAWGSNYASFSKINPEADGLVERGDKFIYTKSDAVFRDYSKAIMDYDLFRTLKRVRSYDAMLSEIKKSVPNAVLTLRTETYSFMASINPQTTNARYRGTYYSQRRGAMVPEIIQASGIIYAHSDYISNYYKASEVYALTKSATERGIVEMHLPLFNRLRDTAINSTYGESVKSTYNTKSDQKGAYINTNASLFTWWKATYEAGGIPGIIWSDILCDGVVGATQKKELKFFKLKLDEAMKSKAAVSWSKDFAKPESSILLKSKAKWSYQPTLVNDILNSTKAQRK